MSRKITTIRTIGKADLDEDIIFQSRDQLSIGDVVDLKTDKPSFSPAYGQAHVIGYEGFAPQGFPIRFKARRTL